MTGMEAWRLVAPIIAAHSVMQGMDGRYEMNALDEAYIIVYGALKEHDEKREKEGKT